MKYYAIVDDDFRQQPNKVYFEHGDKSLATSYMVGMRENPRYKNREFKIITREYAK